MTFIVFLNKKDEIFEYLKKNDSLRGKFFQLITVKNIDTVEFDQKNKLEEIHELLENDTNNNEILNIHNFGGIPNLYFNFRHL